MNRIALFFGAASLAACGAPSVVPSTLAPVCSAPLATTAPPAASSAQTSTPPPSQVAALTAKIAKFAPIALTADVSKLADGDRKARQGHQSDALPATERHAGLGSPVQLAADLGVLRRVRVVASILPHAARRFGIAEAAGFNGKRRVVA